MSCPLISCSLEPSIKCIVTDADCPLFNLTLPSSKLSSSSAGSSRTPYTSASFAIINRPSDEHLFVLDDVIDRRPSAVFQGRHSCFYSGEHRTCLANWLQYR